MTEERKKELIRLIEEDNTESITREEAEELIKNVSEEEKEYILKKTRENMSIRRRKQEFEKECKLEDIQRDRVWWHFHLEQLFKKDFPKEFVYEECKRYVLEYVFEKEPIEIVVEGFRTQYECADCGAPLGKYQPFCSNCGRLIGWSKVYGENI